MQSKFDVVVVGAGPAGVSCGIWLRQLGYSVALVDKNKQCGGLQLNNPWTNTWIATSSKATGKSVAKELHDSAVSHGCTLFLGQTAEGASPVEDGWSVSLADGQALQGKALVLAGGVTPASGGLKSRANLLIGPGEQVAKTDFTGSTVAILGGGDSAFENYGFVKNQGAARVHIYARTLSARAEQLERVPPEDVFVGGYLFDEDTNTVDGVRYDQVLVLYGYEANRAALLGLKPALKLRNFVQTDPDCRTTLPNVWAIGELANRAHPCCVTAMADGVIAAKSIQRALESSTTSRYLKMAKRTMGFVMKAAGK